MDYLILYAEFVKVKIMEIAEYRKAFLIGGIAQFVGYGVEFYLLWLMLEHFGSIHEWESYEVLLLYSFNLFTYALAAFFFFNPVFQLSRMIKDGTFDEVLTKPLNSLLYLVCRETNSAYFIHMGLAILIMVVALTNLTISLSISAILFLILVLIGGALIQGGLMLSIAVSAFWSVENNGLLTILFGKARNFIKYPISIYSEALQFLLTFILPFAFINFFPVQFFLDKNDFTIFHPIFQFLTPAVGLVCITIAYRLWKIGVNNYQSSGS